MQCDLFNLKGRSALVTGGSRGLGKAMARGFAECGAKVMICSRNETELQSAAREISDRLDAEVRYVVTDMARRDEVDALAAAALEAFGTVDILVNNAGVNTPQPIDEITDEAWDRVLEINLTSIMRLTRALVPAMKAQRWGRVIHISSVLGVGSKPARNAYSASKAALMGLAKASALDLGPHGITVNCIGPGPFLTDMPMSLLSEAEKEEFSNVTALKRWGQPRELAGPALLLASEAGSYITGEMLLVDGGAFARAL
ncbi:MAG: SDR family oxidoreductase [Verrucomicrobiales bacterium]|jgi:NAD(P)-dependent dehydrogenase (short-subunit alcohol dehydrogenase family)|nr:SDR family oxidoreductase [Verrucomicrobiales bacterium]MDP5006362.1 SDR family oxidoreductase [Verrucomicrobiales bacterium]